MKMNRVMAIAEKDMKEFMRNMMLLSMPVVPIILAALYSRMPLDEMGKDRYTMVIMVIAICFASILTSGMMTMMAEENEKHTLRGLVNSPASIFEVLTGKSIVVSVITVITTIICLLILKINILFNVQMVIGIIGLFLFFLLLGIGVGLHVKTVASTSGYLLPILFIFAMGSMMSFLGLDKDHAVMKVLKVTLVTQYGELAKHGGYQPLIIIFIWVIAALTLTYFLYRKNSVDDKH